MRDRIKLRIKQLKSIPKRAKLRCEIWWLTKKMSFKQWQIQRLKRAKEVQSSREFVEDNE